MKTATFTICRPDTGAVLPYAVVTVYKSDGITKAVIYNSLGIVITNSVVVADANGAVAFQAADGTYVLSAVDAEGDLTVPPFMVEVASSDGSIKVDTFSTLQKAADYAASETVTGPPITPGGADTLQTRLARVDFGPNIYPISSPLIHYSGQTWQGHGSAETANRLNTKICPAQDIDGIRVSPQINGGNAFHNGLITNLTIMGPGAGNFPNYFSTFAGAIAALIVGSNGSGYTSAPTVTLSGGGGSGATATAMISSSGVVSGYQVTNQGSGYTSPPTVNHSGGGGSGAAANAIIVGGKVVAITTGGYFTCDEGTPGSVGSYQRISSGVFYQAANRGWFPSAWGYNLVSSDGGYNVASQGQSSIRRATVRGMASGGFRAPNGGLQVIWDGLTSLTNGGIGFYLKTPFNTSVQSFVISNCSSDSATSGAGFWWDTPNVGGHTSWRDIKSEANINKEYGAKTTFTASCSGTALTTSGSPSLQDGSIVYDGGGAIVGVVTGGSGNSWTVNPGGTFASQTMTAYYKVDQINAFRAENAAAGATINVDGGTHISAGSYFPGGTSVLMPGSFFSISGPNTPDLIWNNVQIRVLAAQTEYPMSEYSGGATATISAGAVTAITDPTVPGLWPSGTSLKVRLVGGGGSGATATAVVTNGRIVTTLTNGGTGYTSAPAVRYLGPPGIFEDLTYGPRIDRKFTSGRYSDTWRADLCRSSTTRWILGTACDYMAQSIEGPGWQLAGSTPALSLYATGAAADQRKVMIVNSNGAVSIRTVTDAGTATAALTVNNTSGVSGSVEVNAVFRPSTDNTRTLGSASFRWSQLFAGTTTINTSDERAKVWRGPLDGAEKRAARRIKDLIGAYQWADSVAEKGADGARIHYGVRAQEVVQVMIDEGLEPMPFDGWRDEPLFVGAYPVGTELSPEEFASRDITAAPRIPSFRHAFLCVDSWGDEWVPIEGEVQTGVTPVGVDEDGNVVGGEPIWEPGTVGWRCNQQAGSRYGLRDTQLQWFIMGALL